ncbi:MAG: ABC transporter ATP-binding protein [Dermatophilus congolensis]|nr:ABC transporter ATP-binding protein [Dermatophilus congolensis]
MRSIVRLLRMASHLTGAYVAIVITGVLAALTGLAMPFIIGRATDVVVGALSGNGATTPSPITTVLWLAVALFAMDLFNTVITNVGGYLGDTTAARLRHQLSTRYYAHLLRLPQSYFDRELSGTVISRLNRSITETTQFLNGFANNFFPMLLTVFGVLVVSAFYSWPLTILLVLIYPIFTWLTALTSKRWQVLESEKNTLIDRAGGRFAEVVGQIRVVKSFAAEQRELDHFRSDYDDTVGITRRQSRFWHTMDGTRRGTLSVIFLAVYALIFVETIQGAYSVGSMVLLIQLVNMARQPVMMMSFLVDSAQRAIAGSKDYLAVMDETPEPAAGHLTLSAPGQPVRTTSDEGQPGAAAPTTPVVATGRALGPDTATPGAPAIEFDSVTFGYGDDRDVVSDVSFAVNAGDQVAIVSESGGGKSTIVSLLLGLYRPRAGRIRVFGHDISDLTREELRSAVGVVFQEPALFSGTVSENIAYGRPEADATQIERAAMEANAHSFIRGFSDAYDAVIGERGLRLSGGQKQRIAVARAMLKDAPILVLDEATSALDTKSERLVQEGLERLMTDRTSLIIAHRLSTISRVDQIITLRSGHVDEIGSPDELASTTGIYAELLALQASDSKRDRRLLQRRYGMRG